jgi:hypothetical protein
MEVTILKEKWYEFFRYKCKEGYIDRWSGDCINNPNNEKKSPCQLNSFATYFRCGDKRWVRDRYLKHNFLDFIKANKEKQTAEEIFKEGLREVLLNYFNTEDSI